MPLLQIHATIILIPSVHHLMRPSCRATVPSIHRCSRTVVSVLINVETVRKYNCVALFTLYLQSLPIIALGFRCTLRCPTDGDNADVDTISFEIELAIAHVDVRSHGPIHVRNRIHVYFSAYFITNLINNNINNHDDDQIDHISTLRYES